MSLFIRKCVLEKELYEIDLEPFRDLQSLLSNATNNSKNWDDFLNKMANLGYEIKYGKHIAFKHKDKERFTRDKTIGEDYIEEKLKERIAKSKNIKPYPIKKRVGKVLNTDNNNKLKESKGY